MSENMSLVTKLPNGGTRTVTEEGYILYKNADGLLHRNYEEGPAVIIPNDCVEFHTNGKFHRPVEEGPAVIWSNGAYEYILNNVRHNPNGPAIWTPFAFGSAPYIVKFVHNGMVINDPEICGPFFLKKGDEVYSLLNEKDEPSVGRIRRQLPKNPDYEGQDMFEVQFVDDPELGIIPHPTQFLTKKVDLNINELYRLPQEQYDSIDWESL